MKPIEIMAVIVAAAVIIKLIFAFVSPESWLNVVTKKVWNHPILLTLISLAWAIAALKFLLEELTIVQIFAALFFLMPLVMISFVPFTKDLLGLAETLFRDRSILKKAWLGIIIWLILSVWVLYAFFV